MQYSLGKESYAGDDGTGCCGRNALSVVNNNSIKHLKILTCRRNTLEAISQLTLMYRNRLAVCGGSPRLLKACDVEWFYASLHK
jgi:hypothetical protein